MPPPQWPDGPAAASFELPPPPSTNTLYVNPTAAMVRYRGGKRITPGRLKTKAYKQWLDDAGWEMRAQHPTMLPHFAGKIVVLIEGIARIDLDNIKAIPDLLRRMNVIADDNLVDDLRIVRHGFGTNAKVSIWPIDRA